MKKIYIKIDGMMCTHCYQTVSKIIQSDFNVKKVKINRNIATVWYENEINIENIIEEINKKGYVTKKEYVSKEKSKIDDNVDFLEFILIACSIILVILVLNEMFGFNIFNMIPTIDTNIQLGMLFVTGLFTSIHCISMCGAINLYASSSKEEGKIKKFKNPLLYNIGRLLSYTILGGIIGGIGKAFSINYMVKNIIILIASIFMLIMSLSMLGVITISGRLKNCKCFSKVKVKNHFIIGILNGFMPCGPLQAMQIYALSTASVFYGAMSMFLFCLGTIPLMMFFGSFINLCKGKIKVIINKVASVLILILSILMLNRALVGFGIDINSIFSKTNDAQYIKAIKEDGYQYIEFDLDYGDYKDIIVQKDVPVKIIINVDKKYLTGCNNEIIIKDFKIDKKLNVGTNEIEFTPQEEGEYIYSCWMNMIKNKIKVIDNKDYFKEEN